MNPGFTVSAVVVHGLGLGAALTMLSVINAVFLRPLPFPEPDRIVNVVRDHPRFGGLNPIHPQRNIAFLRDNSRAFSALAGIVGFSPGVNLVSEHGSTYFGNLEVTAGFLQVLGVAPRLGRAFSRDGEIDPATVVLGHDVWVGHFEGDPDIVGRDGRLGGRPHTVIGVMPPEFWSFEEAEAWTPFRPDPERGDQNYQLIGRLAPEWSEAQAEAELQALSIRLNTGLSTSDLGFDPRRRASSSAQRSPVARSQGPGQSLGPQRQHRVRRRTIAGGAADVVRTPAGECRSGPRRE